MDETRINAMRHDPLRTPSPPPQPSPRPQTFPAPSHMRSSPFTSSRTRTTAAAAVAQPSLQGELPAHMRLPLFTPPPVTPAPTLDPAQPSPNDTQHAVMPPETPSGSPATINITPAVGLPHPTPKTSDATSLPCPAPEEPDVESVPHPTPMDTVLTAEQICAFGGDAGRYANIKWHVSMSDDERTECIRACGFS